MMPYFSNWLMKYGLMMVSSGFRAGSEGVGEGAGAGAGAGAGEAKMNVS